MQTRTDEVLARFSSLTNEQREILRSAMARGFSEQIDSVLLVSVREDTPLEENEEAPELTDEEEEKLEKLFDAFLGGESPHEVLIITAVRSAVHEHGAMESLQDFLLLTFIYSFMEDLASAEAGERIEGVKAFGPHKIDAAEEAELRHFYIDCELKSFWKGVNDVLTHFSDFIDGASFRKGVLRLLEEKNALVEDRKKVAHGLKESGGVALLHHALYERYGRQMIGQWIMRGVASSGALQAKERFDDEMGGGMRLPIVKEAATGLMQLYINDSSAPSLALIFAEFILKDRGDKPLPLHPEQLLSEYPQLAQILEQLQCIHSDLVSLEMVHQELIKVGREENSPQEGL